MDKIKILFLAANPKGTVPLRLDEEIREISAKIRLAKFCDSLELVSIWATRPSDLLQSLLEHKPHIVHFSGHGTVSDEITLEDSSGQPKSVSKEALTALFQNLKDNIRVVMLNACYSRPQAEAITNVIDSAIGMKGAIGDQAAIKFAASFYQAIGFGRTLKEAFDIGKTALMLEGIAEENTPQLHLHDGIDATKVVLINGAISYQEKTITNMERQVIRYLFVYLEDRRAITLPLTRLYSKAVISIDQVRDELTKAIQRLPEKSKALKYLRRMRQACRDFLESMEAEFEGTTYTSARRKLQHTFASEVTGLSVEYGIDLSPELSEFIKWWKEEGHWYGWYG